MALKGSECDHGTTTGRAIPLESLNIILTSECNLRCAYCYQDAKQPGVIGWTDLRAALDLVPLSTARSVNVIFTGGEPLREFVLIRRAVEYLEGRRPRRLAVQYEVCTNGLLMRGREADFFDRKRFLVHLSFDGIEPAQEIRAPGTFRAMDRLLVRLRTEQPGLYRNRFNVGVTLVPAAVPFLSASVEYFIRRRVEDLRISPGLRQGEKWNPEWIGELDRQFARVFEICLRHREQTGAVPVGLFRNDGNPDRRSAASDWLCGVGSTRAVTVDVDGMLCGCAPLARSYKRYPTTRLGRRVAGTKLCHVSQTNHATDLLRYRDELEKTLVFNHRRSKYSSYGRCGFCQYLNTCAICPMSIVFYAEADDPHRVPDFLCAFSRIRAKYSRRFPLQRRPSEVRLGGARGSGLPAEFWRGLAVMQRSWRR